jgi:hypothetical protein
MPTQTSTELKNCWSCWGQFPPDDMHNGQCHWCEKEHAQDMTSEDEEGN